MRQISAPCLLHLMTSFERHTSARYRLIPLLENETGTSTVERPLSAERRFAESLTFTATLQVRAAMAFRIMTIRLLEETICSEFLTVAPAPSRRDTY